MDLSGKRVLVTGGTGLLGSHLVPRLVDRKADVTVLSRRGGVPDGAPGGVVGLAGNITDPASLDLTDQDLVVHAAAWVGFGLPKRKRALLWETNVEGTRNVLDAAASADVERVLHVSSVAAIGATPAGLYNADHVWDRVPYWKSEYERTKYEAHVLALEREDLDVVSVLPSVILGLGPTGSGLILQSYLEGRIPAVPKGDRPTGMVHVKDVAEGIVLALEKGTDKQAFVLNELDLTVAQLMEVLEDATGVPAPARRVPLGVLKALGTVVETTSHLLGRTPPVSREVIDSLELPMTYDASRARKVLGWEPRMREHLAADAEAWRSARGG